MGIKYWRSPTLPHYFCCRHLGFTALFRQLAKRQFVSFAAAGLTVAVIHTAVFFFVPGVPSVATVLLLLPSLQPLRSLLLLKLPRFLASRSCCRLCSCWRAFCCWKTAILLLSLLLLSSLLLLASLLLFRLLPYCRCPCCCCHLCSSLRPCCCWLAAIYCWRPCCCWLAAILLVSLLLLSPLLLLASLLLLLVCWHFIGVLLFVVFALVGLCLLLLACSHIIGVPAVVGLLPYCWRPCCCWLAAILLASLLLLACCHIVAVVFALLCVLAVAGVSAVAGDPADGKESVFLFQHIPSTNQLDWPNGKGWSRPVTPHIRSFPFSCEG